MATLWLKDLVAALRDSLFFVSDRDKANQTSYDVLSAYWCMCYYANPAVKVLVLALSTLGCILSVVKHKAAYFRLLNINLLIKSEKRLLYYMLRDEERVKINNNEVVRPSTYAVRSG